MARETIIVDDFDGTGPANTYYFIVGDKEYAVDLGEDNAKDFQSILDQFEEKMAPYIRAGRGIGRANPRRPATSSSSKPDYDVAEVRAWGRDNGYEVSDRGRLSTDLVTAWRAASKK